LIILVGEFLNIPNYDLYPQDYLKFAEEELENMGKSDLGIRTKINCILHLKRALDCQLDVFFYALGFSDYLKGKNLGFNSKLRFLRDVGIINSRVIDRFNTLRNKIEHHYKIPAIEDIEVYYDLIHSLVSNIEMALFAISFQTIISFSRSSETPGFLIEYNIDELPRIIFEIDEHEQIFQGEVSISELEEFTKVFKIYYLLCKRDLFLRENYILDII
jgi:hypothetical protein